MNVFESLWRRSAVAAVMTGLVLTSSGCGVQPREGDPAVPEPQRDSLAAEPEVSAELPKTPSEEGPWKVEWSIRRALPRKTAHRESSWALGEALQFEPVIQGAQVATVEPLEWPDEPESVLLVQLRYVPGGDWSARCSRPDGSMEEVLHGRRLLWDEPSQSGLLDLSEVFGSRGDLRDPATVCTLRVEVERQGAYSALTYSFRVMAGLPNPSPTERRDFAWSEGGLLREELWQNRGFRNLKLQVTAGTELVMTSVIHAQPYVQLLGKGRQFKGQGQSYVSQFSGLAIEARAGEEGRWTAWAPLPLTVRWPAGSSLRIEYRLRPVAGARSCSLADRNVVRFPYPMKNTSSGVQLRRVARHLHGSISWAVAVQDPARVLEGGQIRQSDRGEAFDLGDAPAGLEGSAFDCHGWVP